MVRPASSSAARIARTASVSVLTPESREYSVRPTPAIAVRSRSGCSANVHPAGLDAGVLEHALPARVLAVAGVAEPAEGQGPVDAPVRVHPHRARVEVA